MGLLSFLMLGFLIGNLAGLSAEGIVRDLLPLLFAFGGGSAAGLAGLTVYAVYGVRLE